MKPSELALGETLRYLERSLAPAPKSVLEVGAGDGGISLALAERGYEVTALDEAFERPEAARSGPVRWVEVDFLHYDAGERFDAVVFTRSLHHMVPLARALDRAESLLSGNGRFVAEEFAYDRVNLPTARWFYDLESVLVEAGILAPAEGGETEGNPLGRWRREHTHDPPLQSGHSMLAAARERFDVEAVEEAPYLYRYFADRLEASERGLRVARRILELESRLIRERDIAAAGLRMVGARRD